MGQNFAKIDTGKCSWQPVIRDETPEVLNSKSFVTRD
jgi:hypothetical protein